MQLDQFGTYIWDKRSWINNLQLSYCDLVILDRYEGDVIPETIRTNYSPDTDADYIFCCLLLLLLMMMRMIVQ